MKGKKIIALLLALILVASCFAGCGGSSGKLKIGMIQIEDHTSLNQIRDSIIAEIEAQGYKDKVEIDIQNANGDFSNINTICQKFIGDSVDLIVAIATPTAQGAANATKDIPIVFSAVSDPEAANLADVPNVTGTSDAIPIDKIFSLAAELTPNAKKFGLLYNVGEVNSVSAIKRVKEYAAANGLTIEEASVTNTSEVQQATQSLIDKGVQALFSPTDNTVAKAMALVKEEAINAKIPVYTGADSMVIDGGLATFGIDYTVLGKQTANMVIDILFNGKQPSDISIEVLENFSPVINTTTAEAIGVVIPESLLATAKTVE